MPGEGENVGHAGAPKPEQQTETTLTTRARINIPGSRPIPPIVVRETVNETTAQGLPAAAPPPEAAASADAGTAAGAGAGEDKGKKTSSWFEPRKPPRPGGVPMPGTVGAGAAAGAGEGRPPRPQDGPPSRHASTPPPPGPPSETPAGGIPGLGRSAPTWFPATDTPPDGTASVPAMPPAPRPDGGPLPAPTPQRSSAPPTTPAPRAAASASGPTPTPPHGVGPLGPGMGGRGPAGPTTGPGTGSTPMPPPGEDLAATTMDLGGPFPPAPPPGRVDSGLTATGSLPTFGPDARPTPGGPPTPAGGLPGLASIDGPDAAERDGREGRERRDGKDEEPAAAPASAGPSAAAAAARRRKRGRLRLALLGLAGVGVVAYGAGLLLNSDDVPRGTTVLGVDLGGTTSQEATNRLESALDHANNDPLTVVVGGQEVKLLPSVAGLAVDTEATVRSVSGQDYSPVTVIGSLFGAERAEEAVFAIDREKLTVALEDISAEHSGDGAPIEGDVTFENGEAIGHPGEPGRALDVAAAVEAVEAEFRERAATGRETALELPMTEQQPAVDAAEVERAMDEFAEPAMSGWLWVVAGDAELAFADDGTLSRLLSMEPSDNGTLQPVMDLEGLAEAYGSTFDNVMIDSASGLVPVTPEHIAAAMINALREPAVANEGVDRREAVVTNAVSQ
ncbi:peptidoglycan binding domain-containing protein [Streptomyces sp. 4N509B]|uniref:peptidoglycan binding domain-containing protein n=1 Tax=Streptomyces sp. 4N509B TaxID=3457413 RepID=UPI003FCF8A64